MLSFKTATSLPPWMLWPAGATATSKATRETHTYTSTFCLSFSLLFHMWSPVLLTHESFSLEARLFVYSLCLWSLSFVFGE
eukprot:m.222562 g.222562  ORF g.222562 m.222562 type:complete len:81 (+) comp16055_c0_seq1:659-901(+)